MIMRNKNAPSSVCICIKLLKDNTQKVKKKVLNTNENFHFSYFMTMLIGNIHGQVLLNIGQKYHIL